MNKQSQKPSPPDPVRDIVAERASDEIAAKLPIPAETREIAKTGIRAGIKKLWKMFKKK